MRDPDRIPLVLAAIEREWRKHPDLRLGQMIVNAVGRDEKLVFGVEDDKLIRLFCEELTEEERAWVESEPARRHAGLRESLTYTSETAQRLLATRSWRDVKHDVKGARERLDREGA